MDHSLYTAFTFVSTNLQFHECLQSNAAFIHAGFRDEEQTPSLCRVYT